MKTIKNPICLVQNKVKKVVVDNVNMTIDIYTKEVSSSAPTDLTNYEVTVPANWTASAGFGVFNLFGTITNLSSNNTRILSNVITENFKIGYNSSGTIANQIVYINDNGNTYGISSVDSFNLYITGGNDATNSQLIQCLVDNNATFKFTGGGSD